MVFKLKKENKICIKCKNKIKDNEKHVLIETFFDENKSSKEWFHWKCWLDYFRESVEKKVMGLTKTAMGNVSKLMGNLNLGVIQNGN
jgi:hypothetical protein